MNAKLQGHSGHAGIDLSADDPRATMPLPARGALPAPSAHEGWRTADMRRDSSSRGRAQNPRIVVLGNTSSGKTTIARRVARVLDLPFVELDALFWEANWTPADEEVFRGRVEAAATGDHWVADGNYSPVRGILWPRATTIVWLDYPLLVSLWRLLRRTVGRALRGTELWEGNRESLWRHFATRESLFLWAVTSYRRRRAQILEALEKPEHAHLELHRFRKPSQAARWEAGLRANAVFSLRGPDSPDG